MQDISAQYLVSVIDNTMNDLLHGILHRNCSFYEPLYGETSAKINWKTH